MKASFFSPRELFRENKEERFVKENSLIFFEIHECSSEGQAGLLKLLRLEEDNDLGKLVEPLIGSLGVLNALRAVFGRQLEVGHPLNGVERLVGLVLVELSDPLVLELAEIDRVYFGDDSVLLQEGLQTAFLQQLQALLPQLLPLLFLEAVYHLLPSKLLLLERLPVRQEIRNQQLLFVFPFGYTVQLFLQVQESGVVHYLRLQDLLLLPI